MSEIHHAMCYIIVTRMVIEFMSCLIWSGSNNPIQEPDDKN